MSAHMHSEAVAREEMIDELLEDLMLQEYELARMAED